MTEKKVQLKVVEALQDDAYKGIARIDSEIMRELGIKRGDVILIKGNKETIAIADRAYPADVGEGIIRIDGILRRNARTGIGDVVSVSKVEIKEAKKVIIAPAQKGIMIQADSNSLRRGLLGRAIVKGDIVVLGGVQRRRDLFSESMDDEFSGLFGEMLNNMGFGNLGGGITQIKFLVVNISPSQPCIVTENTEVTLNPKAVEISEEKIPEITYEDIGGLDDEVKKIREMVEIPMKHPEIFERLSVEPPKGVLLHGPPGTGKTLLAKAVANETDANFILLNGPEVMCVSGETQVLTNPDGYIKAKQIYLQEGKDEKFRDYILKKLDKPISTYSFKDGKIEKANITHVTKLEAESFKLELSDGNEIIASENQPFLVYRNGELVWEAVRNLNKGDFVARLNKIDLEESSFNVPLSELHQKFSLTEKDGNFAIKSINLSRSNFIKLPKKTSSELLELLGLIVSDGNISGKDDSIGFYNNNIELIERFKFLVKRVFNIDNFKEKNKGKMFGVIVYSKLLVEYLRLLKFTSENKEHIPSYFFTLPKNEIESFIRGYFDGDGTVMKIKVKNMIYPTPYLYSVKKEFLSQLQSLMLLKLGISTKLAEHHTPKGLMYKLVVRGNEGRVKFLQIGAVSKHKLAALKEIEKVIRVKEYENIPHPSLLIEEIKRIPYKNYRNKDYYIYKTDKATKHSLKVLYDLAVEHNIVNDAVKKEFNTLLRNDIAWERVDNLTPLGKMELYDFTVDKDSFTASPYFLMHNSKFYGESEKRVRDVFEEAEKTAPAIVFIDEIDAIAPKREDVSGEVERRVVSQILTMMDGLKSRGKVIVIGATNRVNALDPALRRPGRFDREIEVGVPDKNGRLQILQIHTRGMPLDFWDINISKKVFLNELSSFEENSNIKISKLAEKIEKISKEKKDKSKELKDLNSDSEGKSLLLKRLENEFRTLEREYERKFHLSEVLELFRLKKSELKKLRENIDDLNDQILTLEKRIQTITKDVKDSESQIDKIRKDILVVRKRSDEFKNNKQLLIELIKEICVLKDSLAKRGQNDPRSIFLKRNLSESEKQVFEILNDLQDSNVLSKEYFDIVRKESIPAVLYEIASLTHGFVGADLEALAKESAMNVLRKLLPEMKLDKEEQIPPEMLEKLIIKHNDFMDALKVVRPSAMREVLVETPNIGWEDVGGLEKVKQELKEAVEWPLKFPEGFDRMGIRPSRGILLYGPPGTGKTLLAKAVAKESEANFIQIKGPELLSKWVGESEEGMRKVFERARQVAPCIVFFDEIDALAGRRGLEAGTKVTERVLNQMLAEMDGLEDLKDVLVIGATNRPDLLDPGLLRPGRFDKILLVTAPTEEGRLKILEIHTKKMPLAKNISLKELAKKTEGYTGADLEAVVREAGMLALRESKEAKQVKLSHFEEALKKIKPSITKSTIEVYKKVEDNYLKAVKAAVPAESSYLG